jgi:hypothetical protein
MNATDPSSLVARASARRLGARQRLYAAFDSYRLSDYGSSEGACPHCLTKDEFDDLAATRLDELTSEQTWLYASAVWPSISDLKYFLPRLLELVEPIHEAFGWDTIERKLPQERWLACSDVEREVVAGYVTAADEYARTVTASNTGDFAALLKPMMVPARIADGLPLGQFVWAELVGHRARLLAEHVQKWHKTASEAAILVLARTLNAVVDGKQKRELKARLRSIVPDDDVVLGWMRSAQPEQMFASALERRLDDDNAACLGAALSNLTLMASTR